MTAAIQQTECSPGQAQPPSRLRSAATWTATRLAAGLDRCFRRRADDGFGILCYHRVGELIPGVEQPTWNVTPERFRAQLVGLLDRGFEAWPLGKFLEARRANDELPSGAFAVTFDDGYENNFLNALPILQELRVPATIFLATAYLDSERSFPFDDWSATGSRHVPTCSWRPLSTWQCRALLASGLIELGAHTHRHELFVERIDAFGDDLEACLDVLAERFGIVDPAFAFPWGRSTPEMIDVVKQAGIPCSMSTRRARVAPGDDFFAWGRFDVATDDTAGTLAGKLSGWYTAVAESAKRLARPRSSVPRPQTYQLAGRRQPHAAQDGASIEPLHTMPTRP